jgi:allantoate deiminase
MANALTARHARQIVARCRELATVTDVPGQTTRTFLSPATRTAQALVTGWMEAAGLSVTIDAIGNLHGLRKDSAPGTPRLLIGSHLDTVIDAGAYDGLLGVLLGVAVAELSEELPFAVEVIAFSEEEGVRFRQPFLGSLALIGESVPVTITDSHGVTLAQALSSFGHVPAPFTLAGVFAYLEVHIEQGPVLEAEGRPLAAVSAIAGQTRLRLTFTGQANHAGTTPMRLRRDALAAAAQWIVAVEACALSKPGLVATVGSIKAVPDLGNVIAGEFAATLDLRHIDDPVRHGALAALIGEAHAAAAQRGVTCAVETLLDQPAVPMDPALTAGLVAAAASCGYDASPIASGAGHDAMILARRVPSAMLFVRTPAGLSHHPGESVLVEDVEAALAACLAFIRTITPPPQLQRENHA